MTAVASLPSQRTPGAPSPSRSELPNLYAENNFDLIRLIAAIEVVLGHTVSALKVDALGPFATAYGYFAGVPAFFFISGFLITASWERRPELAHFYGNRCYRIFPALWASVCLSLVALAIFASPETRSQVAAHWPGFALWTVTQSTFFQAWNPGFLRGFGVGVMNGSLWTIPVELTFYAIVPLLPLVFRRVRADRVLPVVILVSFALNYWFNVQPRTIVQKMVMTSVIPWLGMFLLGMLVQKHIDRIYPYFAGRFWAFLALFVGVSVVSAIYPAYPFLASGNTMGVFNYLAEIALVLSAAYSYRWVSDRVLRRNDLSYGIYIGHMIVLNVLVQCGLMGAKGMAVAVPVIVGLALLSWTFVEKPMLARRRAGTRRALDQVAETGR